jgi:flagellar basal-body rod protein FlgF/flagellar basal-body rod protein FlgG
MIGADGLGEPSGHIGRATAWESEGRVRQGRSAMENALLIGLSRQMALERQMDVVANNVANVNTNGYKADNPLFEEYLMPVARENRFNLRDRLVSFVNDRGTWRDTRAGSLEITKNPLDVAIDGNGYLVVQTPAGERYTRNGALQINAQGQLITSDGLPVLGDNGPITFQQTDHNISITPDGRVTVIEGLSSTNAEALRGTLRLVSFAQPQLLQKEGNNLFSAGGAAATPDTTSRLMQGTLEKSNVQAVTEIARMIQISRAYQQTATLLQQQSDLHKNAIHELAQVPA